MPMLGPMVSRKPHQRDGLGLHSTGQCATENEAVSFASVLDDPPAAMESGEMLSFEQARAVYLGDFRERHADGNPDSIAAGEQ